MRLGAAILAISGATDRPVNLSSAATWRDDQLRARQRAWGGSANSGAVGGDVPFPRRADPATARGATRSTARSRLTDRRPPNDDDHLRRVVARGATSDASVVTEAWAQL
jgi:hypothetical protein